MEMESRTPKGRGKRRGAANTPVNDTRTLRKGRRGSSVQTFTAPPSPAKSEPTSSGLKRKGRPTDIDLSAAEQRSTKRSRSGSQAPTPNSETPPTDAQGFIECPEPNCNKKYRNANGLKYHQSHAHSGSNSNLSVDDSKDEMDCEDIPLSVVKNSVKKEKESKKENHSSRKEKDKHEQNDKKSDKSSDNVSGKKNNKDDNENKATGDKNDPKCDNGASASKKKDKDLANNKASVGNSGSGSGKAQTSVSKCNGNSSSSQVTVSSQGNSSTIQSVPSQSLVSPSSSLVSSSATSTLTVVTSTNAMQSTTQGDSSKADTTNKLIDIKPKVANENAQRATKPNRPIVPAPTHTVLSSMQVTHSNLAPVMSHTQMSPQLKPIQPKPTIMGEPQNINPALADLNKDRKKVQKKKPKDGPQGGNTPQKPDQPTIKIERSGVIKTNPMPSSKGHSDSHKNAGSKDTNRPHGNELQRSHLAPNGQKGSDHSRAGQNPNLLKVGSPLQVNTPDKAPVNDDVQSPAYSDISDANESASPAAPSDTSPQKSKEEKKKDKSEAPVPASSESQSVSHYGMYYYGQSPYSVNSMSPGQKNPGPNNPGPNVGGPQSQKSGLDNKGPSQNKDKPMTPEESSKGEKKPDPDRDGNRPKGIPPHIAGPPPSNMSPQQMQEYQNVMMYQQMYLQGLPPQVQYQYMANGWYPPSMDPNYMRQMMDERRGDRDGPAGTSRGSEREGDSNHGQDNGKGPQGVSGTISRKDDNLGAAKSMISPGQQSQGSERGDKKVGDDKGVKDQALRDKQSENHQILKENIELKNEMDKSKMFRQADEMRRLKMYQEQKMIEERKKMELARKGDNRPENLSKAPGTKPIVDHSARNLSGQRMPSDISKDSNSKRENVNSDSKMKDSHSRESSLGKYPDSSRPLEDKTKNSVPDKHRAETPIRNPDTPKQRPGGSSSKSGSPCSVGPASIPGSPGSYSPYVHNYPYMQNPHFMGMDPTHPMYRNPSVNPALISGFPPGSYIHPSQMGYRPGSESEEKDKPSVLKSNPPPSESEQKKNDSSSVGPYYGNMHKIHELSEKGRPKSRTSSPVLGKPTDTSTSVYEKHRDYTNSPPTQRHVHTHHHTHVLQTGPGLQAAPSIPGPPNFYQMNDPYSGK